MIILFKYCVDVENCKSFRGFSYIYIYIYRLHNQSTTIKRVQPLGLNLVQKKKKKIKLIELII